MLRRQLQRAMSEDEQDASLFDMIDEQPATPILSGLVSWLQDGKAWRVRDGRLTLYRPNTTAETLGLLAKP